MITQMVDRVLFLVAIVVLPSIGMAGCSEEPKTSPAPTPPNTPAARHTLIVDLRGAPDVATVNTVSVIESSSGGPIERRCFGQNWSAAVLDFGLSYATCTLENIASGTKLTLRPLAGKGWELRSAD